MAEGLLRLFAGDRFEVVSAGTQPVGLNPLAVEAMRELGADITFHRSKDLAEFLSQRFDYVVTVCDRAKESCPNFPGASALVHWSFEDPAAVQGSQQERLAAFRKIRDQIAARLKQFLLERPQPPQSTGAGIKPLTSGSRWRK